MDKRYLIAVDLDYTALDNVYELNDITVEVLKQVKSMGHLVMIATARPTCMTLPHYKRLELDTWTAICNGADLVADLAGEHQTLRRKYMPASDLEKIFDIIPLDEVDDMGIERNDVLYIHGTMKGSVYHEEMIKLSNVEYFDLSSIPLVDAGRIFLRIKDTPEVMECIDELKSMESITLYYRKIHLEQPGVYMSIKSVYADKWYAVKEAAAHYGIPEKNIIAFGDDYNDVMMLKNAGLGFVMCNGNEEVKREIGRITQYSNIEGGVGRELARLFDIKIK